MGRCPKFSKTSCGFKTCKLFLKGNPNYMKIKRKEITFLSRRTWPKPKPCDGVVCRINKMQKFKKKKKNSFELTSSSSFHRRSRIYPAYLLLATWKVDTRDWTSYRFGCLLTRQIHEPVCRSLFGQQPVIHDSVYLSLWLGNLRVRTIWKRRTIKSILLRMTIFVELKNIT